MIIVLMPVAMVMFGAGMTSPRSQPEKAARRDASRICLDEMGMRVERSQPFLKRPRIGYRQIGLCHDYTVGLHYLLDPDDIVAFSPRAQHSIDDGDQPVQRIVVG